MKRYLGLLPMLFLGTVTFAAPGLKPGGLAEFSAELPRELRLGGGARATVSGHRCARDHRSAGWLAAAFAREGRTIAGIYLAGISTDSIVAAAKDFNVMRADFRRVPILLQSADRDLVATPSDHWRIYDELKRAGFRNLRVETVRGTHDVDPAPLRKALDWFRESATPAATSR